MNNISKFETSEPPDILYKYVSQEGLLGIFNSNSIWATDIFYMNDAAEYQHAVNLMYQQINRRLAQLKSHPPPLLNALRPDPEDAKYDKKNMEKVFLVAVQEVIGDLSKFHIFVCSFTVENDLLSQWRGYCPKGNGYSIGFNTSLLVNAFNRKNYSLVKFIYNTEEQLKVVDDLLQKYINKIPDEEVALSNGKNFVKPSIKKLISVDPR